MACPLCGDECRCPVPAAGNLSPGHLRSRPRFQPRMYAGNAAAADSRPASPATALVDPDACDVSEQQFAASLETDVPRPRFVAHPPEEPLPAADEPRHPPVANEREAPELAAGESDRAVAAGASENIATGLLAVTMEEEAASPPFSPPEPATGGSAWNEISHELWREEVAARVSAYRARRRRRGPRYPSLTLKFGPPEAKWMVSPAGGEAASSTTTPARAWMETEAQTGQPPAPAAHTAIAETPKIIRFPRSAPAPAFVVAPADELAEPVTGRPRILEAPESLSATTPALGGITLEEHVEEVPSAPGLEAPLPVAPLRLRLLAAAIDGVFVAAAASLFAFIFPRVSGALPPLRVAVVLLLVLPCLLWAVYQYLFLVHVGSTPGLRLCRLRINRFDGKVPGRGLRRWRALAMTLSGVSLGLGFLWSLLDEDTLCWHDRITRTYLALGKPGTQTADGTAG